MRFLSKAGVIIILTIEASANRIAATITSRSKTFISGSHLALRTLENYGPTPAQTDPTGPIASYNPASRLTAIVRDPCYTRSYPGTVASLSYSQLTGKITRDPATVPIAASSPYVQATQRTTRERVPVPVHPYNYSWDDVSQRGLNATVMDYPERVPPWVWLPFQVQNLDGGHARGVGQAQAQAYEQNLPSLYETDNVNARTNGSGLNHQGPSSSAIDPGEAPFSGSAASPSVQPPPLVPSLHTTVSSPSVPVPNSQSPYRLKRAVVDYRNGGQIVYPNVSTSLEEDKYIVIYDGFVKKIFTKDDTGDGEDSNVTKTWKVELRDGESWTLEFIDWGGCRAMMNGLWNAW